MLRADGTLWDAPNEDWGKSLTPLPPELHTMALAAGVARFPWLAEVLPARPLDAEDCPTCSGRGEVLPAGAASGTGILCPRCHALGWLHAGAG